MKSRITLQKIADALGYSKTTISFALRNSREIPEATRKLIQEEADKMGYKRNPAISQLMSDMRSSQSNQFKAKLALINANEDPEAFRRHPTIPTYVEGCERRATALGYSFDRFWLHDEKMPPKRLLQIFNTRNIRGIVIVGLMGKNQLPQKFIPLWEAFPSIVTGVRTRKPTLSFASVDHHDLTFRAMEKLYALGYRRPALVVDKEIDILVEGRFSAGYFTGQSLLKKKDRLQSFFDYQLSKKNPDIFKNWILNHKPDVVLTLYHSVQAWLEEMGLSVPEDMGYFQLELRRNQKEIAGMNQHNDIVGEAAVEMLIAQIISNERGLSDFPRATQISASWHVGPTIQK